MNVFKTKDSGGTILTVENFENLTNKKSPYYQSKKNGKEKHYAICPACGNPVTVVNLYKDNYIDVEKNRVSLHARHHKGTIPGIAEYDEQKYKECPLHRDSSFGEEILREDNEYNEKLKVLIESNTGKIKNHIRVLLGINISDKRLTEIINSYIINRNYQYIHTNEFNIPYSIIYTCAALNIYNNYIYDCEQGKEIKEHIVNDSRLFTVEGNRIVKETSKYSQIDIQLCNHVKRNNRWYITLKLSETLNNNTTIIFKKRIEIKSIILV